MKRSAKNRRGFLHGMLAAGAVSAAAPSEMDAQSAAGATGVASFLPFYARAQNYKFSAIVLGIVKSVPFTSRTAS